MLPVRGRRAKIWILSDQDQDQQHTCHMSMVSVPAFLTDLKIPTRKIIVLNEYWPYYRYRHPI
jgi:hypothetical protein